MAARPSAEPYRVPPTARRGPRRGSAGHRRSGPSGHQPMADEAQPCLHTRPLAVETRIGVGRALMRFVGALLSAEIGRCIAPAAVPTIAARRLFGLEAFHRCPGLD